MDRRTAVQRLLGLAASMALMGGCAVTDPTQYYTLGQIRTGSRARGTASSPTIASTSPPSMASTGAVAIGVGPVIIPGYLDRVQIVTRTGADQVAISMFDRWAESLEDGIARTLADEIGARVPTERIVMFPWRGVVARIIQYQVVVAVLRFDGRPGGDVTLDTRWRILDRDGKELAFNRSTLTEAAAGPGYEPMVAAMTRAVGALGQEIAAEIRAMSR
jgi:uncharacterized lipoprotein YmbA